MSQKILYGLDTYFHDLIKMIDNGKLPKVIMFSGNKGQGKFTLTHHLLAYIFDIKNYDLKLKTISSKSKIFENLKENYNQILFILNVIIIKLKLMI